jgi:CRISPR/Cas system-associated endonuclease Cas1
MSGSITPRHGVVTLFGFGSSARVERGHLILEDGIGLDRRHARLARVNHGLRRLVVVGSDGSVSFAALRWLADQNATFAMLDKDGSVLMTTGPVRSSDARLRRTQALAHHSGVAIHIARELISKNSLRKRKSALGALATSTLLKQSPKLLIKYPKPKRFRSCA